MNVSREECGIREGARSFKAWQKVSAVRKINTSLRDKIVEGHLSKHVLEPQSQKTNAVESQSCSFC